YVRSVPRVQNICDFRDGAPTWRAAHFSKGDPTSAGLDRRSPKKCHFPLGLSRLSFIPVLQPCPRNLDGGVELLLEQFLGREGGQVFGDVDAGLAEFEELDLFLLLSGEEDEAERALLAGLLLVFGE